MDLLLKLFYILFGTDFVIVAFYFLFLSRLFNLLKNKYPDKFRELGEPSLWWNNSPRNGIRVVRFISSKDPIFANDKELLNTKKLTSTFLYIGLVNFLLLIILFFLFFITGNKEF